MKHLAIQQMEAKQKAQAEQASRLAHLEQAVTDSDAEKASLHSIISQKDQELQTLRAQIASIQSTHMQELNNAKNSSIYANSELVHIRSQLEDIQEKHSNLAVINTSLEEQLLAKDRAIENQESESRNLAIKNKDLEETNLAQAKLIEEQKRELLSLSSAIEKQSLSGQRLEELAQSVEELKADKQDLRNDKSLLQEQNKLLLGQIEQLKAEHELSFQTSQLSLADMPLIEEANQPKPKKNILDELSIGESIMPSDQPSNVESSDILDGLTTQKTEYIERELSGEDSHSFTIINQSDVN